MTAKPLSLNSLLKPHAHSRTAAAMNSASTGGRAGLGKCGVCAADLAMAELRRSCCQRRGCKTLLKGSVAAALPQEVEALARPQQGFRHGWRHEWRPDHLIQTEAIPPQAPSNPPLCGGYAAVRHLSHAVSTCLCPPQPNKSLTGSLVLQAGLCRHEASPEVWLCGRHACADEGKEGARIPLGRGLLMMKKSPAALDSRPSNSQQQTISSSGVQACARHRSTCAAPRSSGRPCITAQQSQHLFVLRYVRDSRRE